MNSTHFNLSFMAFALECLQKILIKLKIPVSLLQNLPEVSNKVTGENPFILEINLKGIISFKIYASDSNIRK